ncbi:MAG: AAA family ATPase [Anaerolineales bacterium]
MIPISLSMEGFLSYKEPVEINFTSFDLACITGENGAGKSSILDGITWALFGRARKHDESVINLDSQRAEVSLVFEYEGNQYRVRRVNPRGETKELDLFIRSDKDDSGSPVWNPLTERTMRETDQKIVDILRLDYESFVNASFFLQGEADQFTQHTPAARKKILSQILGLEIWETFRKRALDHRRKADSELNRLDGRLAEIEAELAEEDQRQQRLKDLETQLAEAQSKRQEAEKALEELQAALSTLEEQGKLVASMASHLEENQAQLARDEDKLTQRVEEQAEYQGILHQADTIQIAFQDWQAAQDSLAKWEATAEKFRESEIKRQEPLMQIAAEKARLLQEETSLLSLQGELERNLKRIPELKTEKNKLLEQVEAAQKEIQERDRKVEELDLARQRQAEAKAENPRLFQEMQDLKKRILDLQEAEGALCPLCGQELSEEDRSLLIEDLQIQGKELGDRYRENQATLKEADQVVKDLQLEITQLSLAESKLRSLQAEGDRIDNQLAAINQEKSEWDKKQQGVLEKVQASLKKESYAQDAKSELEKINTELKAIGYDAAEHDRVRDLANQGAAIQDKKAELDKAEAALKPLDREISELREQLQKDRKSLQKEEKEYSQAKQRLENAQENAPETHQAERALLDRKENENILQRDVGAAQQKVAVLQSQKERQEELSAQREDIAHRIKGYQQLEGAFGKDGVPALLIEQALPNIEAKANQILDRLTGGDMSVRFITQRDYKSSSREDKKETLDIQIRDQAGVRDYEMYSGGESFRINFAIRLALSHILAQRAGARLQTLVVDEGFGSQDSIGRQRLIEAINLVQGDFEKILVITHVEEIKEAFSTQLLVEKTPRGSQVALV